MVASGPNPGTRATTGRLPWSVVAVLGVVAGIFLALGLWWGALAALLGTVLCLLDARPLLAALCLGMVGAGYGAAHLQLARPDALAPWIGAQVTLRGHWDGQFLSTAQPVARVALSPKPAEAPGELTVTGRLERPEGQRTPGGFDQAAWLRSQGGLLVPTPGSVLVAAKVKSSQPEHGLRGWFRRGLSVGLSAQQAAIMQAIELGDRGDIGREEFREGYSVRDAFNHAGLAHLMALSGQNVALLTGALIVLLGFLGARPWVRYGLPALLLVPYLVVLVGVSPSITRAVIMGLAVLVGLAIGRGKPGALGTVALAALACLLLFPLWLLDTGFQLSFLAVLALLFSGQLAGRLPERWPHALRLALAATVLAELGTLPLIASNFGQVPLVGLPANLLAELLMAVLVPLGFVSGLLGPAAGLVNWAVGPLASLLLGLANLFGQAPTLGWGHIGAGGYAAYALAAGAGLLGLGGKIRAASALAVALLCAALTWLPNQLRPPRELVFLDVGQGDSTLLRVPGLTMLVDGGGSVGSNYDVGGRTVLPALRALGVRKIDVMVATHADTDHIEGLSTVLRQLPVGELWIGQRKQGDPVLNAVLQAAAERHVPVREIRRGDRVTAPGVTVTALWPAGQVWSTADNDNSVALKIESGGWTTAILGDLPDPAELYLGAGHLDLLKTAHHGSRLSTSADFLAHTTPRDALISVGAHNTYGHPNPDVLERLAAAHVRVWRTDQSGTVRWPVP
ncbi:DNA internalization-related competence protein ComEC/Rec2 [Deinococcus sp.]|uniref:DNA internalization-related competence protein ComEC/Rec2 n=1 Tax=Deinococcus sp. TaxID=47478 RepID=UPI0025BD05A8|nr:DNA internalization-related competence protein ComEC/Rec2 [Deinococcus sp.]